MSDNIIGIIVVAGIIFCIVVTIKSKKKQKKNLENLKKDGFNADQLLKSAPDWVAFDLNNRELAFVGVQGVVKYSFDDVSRWEHTWVDETAQNGQRIKTTSAITFDLKDLDRPVVKVGVAYNSARQWMSKLDTMLNG